MRDSRAAHLQTTRLGRSWRPAWLAARTGGRWLRSRTAWGEMRTTKRDEFRLRTAEDVTRTMGEMKGAVMKLGQVMSLMTGMVPEEMTGELASLHSGAPPMAYALVEQVFREEFGRKPEELFRRFEREPFAAASIGQVHRATLMDGSAAAVKVQYPGVREAIAHDLANAGMLISMAGMLSRGLDAGPVVRDLRQGILGELDYRKELKNQQRFGDIYRGHGFVRVPKVYPELSSERVLVQEYIDGEPLSRAAELSQRERDRIAEMIFRFAFGNFYRHHLFNGDPHPGNYLILRDGTLAFVDYGCVVDFDAEIVRRFEALIDALLRDDREGWRRATEAVGVLRPGAPFDTETLYEHLHWFWRPILADEVTFTRELAGEMVRRNAATTGQGGQINRWLNIPEGMVFLSRINFGLAGLFSGLGASGQWRSIIREYIYGEAPVTELGKLSAATSRGPAI